MDEKTAEIEEKSELDPRTLKPELYEAAKVNDTERVLQLLGKQVPPTFIDSSNGWTALHWAARNGNMVMLTRLIECGASAPYRRMVKQAKQNNVNSTDVALLALASREGKRFSHDLVQNADYSYEGVGTDKSEGSADDNAKEDKSNNQKKNSINKKEKNEKNEDDNTEFLLETSSDLTLNTPLQWSVVKGHLRAVWLLLLEGYSANDVDHLGNNSVHLAAVNGHLQILKVLLEDGGRTNIVNIYKNLPIDMATETDVREALTCAMEKAESLSAADVEQMHKQNMITYTQREKDLNTVILEAENIDSQISTKITANIREIIRKLSDTINDANEWALEENALKKAQTLLLKLESTEDLIHDTATVLLCLPVRTQSMYVQNVHRLERTLCRAEGLHVSPSQIAISRALIKRCQTEYYLSTQINRLKHIACATEIDEHDMMRLKNSVLIAVENNASDDIITEADSLFKRLEVELEMSRAILSVPTVRVPIDAAPKGYWQEDDTGRIDVTEEYPMPPTDNNGEYRWLHSVSYGILKEAVERLKKCSAHADTLGANATIIIKTKENLIKAEKQMKLLEIKDLQDKTTAIEAVAKLLKKKKGGKKTKKPKQ